MRREKERFQALVAAVAIYLAVVGAVLYFFGFRHEEPSRHYVEKNRNGIAVSLGTPAPTRPKAHPTHRPRKAAPPKTAPRPKPHRPKTTRPSPTAHKTARKPARKAPDTRRLFSRVHVPAKKPPSRPSTPAASTKRTGERSIRKATAERGIENRYLAKVERLLRGWPAQANFAGEEIDVILTIRNDGSFDYRIVRRSNNEEFNHALESYLRQLQRIGFGPHNRSRPYEIEVKFVAHE